MGYRMHDQYRILVDNFLMQVPVLLVILMGMAYAFANRRRDVVVADRVALAMTLLLVGVVVPRLMTIWVGRAVVTGVLRPDRVRLVMIIGGLLSNLFPAGAVAILIRTAFGERSGPRPTAGGWRP